MKVDLPGTGLSDCSSVKIGIYNEQSGSIGGSECVVAVLAEALAHMHQVEIVHHNNSLTRERLAEFSGTDLSKVRLRHAALEYKPIDTHNPWRRYREAQAWHAALSEPYDLFINSAHYMPPFCHAPKGVLLILFPSYKLPYTWPWRKGASTDTSPLWKRLQRSLYYTWEWKKRLDSYQLKIAISRFTQSWTKRRWGVDSQVIYSPVDVEYRSVNKENIIISVGRFATTGHTKKQLEMMTAFQQMKDAGSQGWEYLSIGGLGERLQDQAFFEEVRQMGATCGGQALANVERADLKMRYEQAKIFWHAAGYDIDSEAHPEHAEHFGIVTVEAMAAGCVPIVINRGGQPEIVQHGVSGFLWNTLEELKEYTMLVMRDEGLRVRMSEAARIQSQYFSREQFTERFLKFLQPLLS